MLKFYFRIFRTLLFFHLIDKREIRGAILYGDRSYSEPAFDKTKTCVTSRLRSAERSTQYGKDSHLSLFGPALVAQLDTPSDWRPGGRGFIPRRGRQHSSVEIDHEIFSTVILSLPQIQEGQLSVSGERMCTVLVNRLED